MKLQINAKGAWRDVLEFDASLRDQVVGKLIPLARVLEKCAKWSLIDDQGQRHWIATLHDIRDGSGETFTSAEFRQK